MFKDRLRAARKNAGMTQKEVAIAIGVTESAYCGYETGKRQPDAIKISAIASVLGVSGDYLLDTGYDENKKSPALSDEANRIAKQYEALDDHGRRVVRVVIDEETARMASESTQEAVDEPKGKIIPLLRTVAAAGAGEPDTGLPWEDYEVPADSRAEFAVRISGDSMEPHLHDGEIALCLKREPEVGDLVVIMVNGFMVCKQFITDGYNIYLRSLNRDRKDCDIDIWNTGDDTIACFGIVILPHKIPLVRQ